jgi:hypothetical protein
MIAHASRHKRTFSDMRLIFGDKLRLLSAALVLACIARPAASLTLDGPEAVIGQWDLSVSPGAHSCRLNLRGERVAGGFFVGMPAGCRHALPGLASVVAWILPGDNHLDLADAYGKSELDFAQSDGGRLTAAGAQGETYVLTFVEGVPPPGKLPAAAAVPQQVAAAKIVPPRVAPRPGDVAGRYAVLREAGRDTGCMVTLDASGKAFLAPACRDQGIVIFDPTAWRLAGGRLALVARKGHSAQFDLQPDGTWLKDAKDAKSLSLKKI